VRRTPALLAVAVVAAASAALAPPATPAFAADCVPAAEVAYPAVPWAQERLAPQRAWPFSRGDGVTVAVIDTGVSATAPALAGRVLAGRDVRDSGRADSDCAGHGTFVASLVAAGALAGTGFSGIAPGAVIVPIRVADSFDDLHPDVLARGIDAASDADASIIVVVPAAPFGSAALASAVERAEREDRLVIAAGSTSRTGGTAHPAAYRSVLSVAAIQRSGKPLTASSNGGAAPPDLAAPGADLVGAAPSGSGNLVGSAPCLATGLVAGAAALVRGYLPELTAAQVRERLIATADPAPPSARSTLGSGVVNPFAAVTAVDPVAPDASEQAVVAPDPALPQPLRSGHRDSLTLAGMLVAAAALVAIVGGLAGTAAMAARRRRTEGERH